jgi:glycerol uptake operon antiterminator
MSFYGQKVLPAARNMRDIEKLMNSRYQYLVILEMHISRLKSVFQIAKENDKKLILHLDLIQGLKTDEYGTEFICQEFKPFGLISTKSSVITKARQKGVKSIQRVFLLDSSSMEKSFSLIERTQPDFIEVLPGVIPKVIQTIRQRTGKEIFAGGLIDTIEEVESAYEAGAISITTSNELLWHHFEPTNVK